MTVLMYQPHLLLVILLKLKITQIPQAVSFRLLQQKLGMYPKFKPELVSDNTYRTATNVIVGHDGSRTVAYGDFPR